MIGIVGLGYVGVTSALCFHTLGEEIIGIDNNKEIVDNLNSGHLHINDEKLENYFKNNFQSLSFSNDYKELTDLEDVFICVPTEGLKGELDLSIVNDVLVKLDNLNVKNIWIRSTIDKPTVFKNLKTKKSNIFSFPEFLREGKCWDDFFSPPLVVLGGEEVKKTRIFNILKNKISEPSVCTCEEAITVKIACNAFHALKVVFANEVRNISWSKSIDIDRVMSIFVKDSKLNISSSYLKPGLPFGGPCLPKDTQAMANSLFDSRKKLNLFNLIIERNELVKEIYCKKIIDLDYKNIGFYGLEFKPATGDLRNSPIIDIAKLVSKNKTVFAFDEKLDKFSKYPEFTICSDFNELKSNCDIIITYFEVNHPKVIKWSEIEI